MKILVWNKIWEKLNPVLVKKKKCTKYYVK